MLGTSKNMRTNPELQVMLTKTVWLVRVGHSNQGREPGRSETLAR
jgi:hypothetical protein